MEYGSADRSYGESPSSRRSPSNRFVPTALKGVVPGSSPSSRSRFTKSKSKPWQVDRASYKEQMKVRKAVFDNLALEEDENDLDSYGDDAIEEKKSTDYDRDELLGITATNASSSYDDTYDDVSVGLTATTSDDSLPKKTIENSYNAAIHSVLSSPDRSNHSDRVLHHGLGHPTSPIDLASHSEDELSDYVDNKQNGGYVASVSELARNASQLAWSAAESSQQANDLVSRARITLHDQQSDANPNENLQREYLVDSSYIGNNSSLLSPTSNNNSNKYNDNNNCLDDESMTMKEGEEKEETVAESRQFIHRSISEDEEEPPSLQKPEQRRSSLIISQTSGGKFQTYTTKVRSCKSLLMSEDNKHSDPLQRARMSLVLSHMAGRVEEVYKGHHQTIEAVGTGEARIAAKKNAADSNTNNNEMNAIQQSRNNVMDELSDELTLLRTDKFHVVESYAGEEKKKEVLEELLKRNNDDNKTQKPAVTEERQSCVAAVEQSTLSTDSSYGSHGYDQEKPTTKDDEAHKNDLSIKSEPVSVEENAVEKENTEGPVLLSVPGVSDGTTNVVENNDSAAYADQAFVVDGEAARSEELAEGNEPRNFSQHEACENEVAVLYGDGSASEEVLSESKDDLKLDPSLQANLGLASSTLTGSERTDGSVSPVESEAEKADQNATEGEEVAATGVEIGASANANEPEANAKACSEVAVPTEIEQERKVEEVETRAEKPTKGKKRESLKGKKWKERLQAKKEMKQQNTAENIQSQSSPPAQIAIVSPGSQSMPTQEADGSPSSPESKKSKKWKNRLAKKRNSKEDSKLNVESIQVEDPASSEKEEALSSETPAAINDMEGESSGAEVEVLSVEVPSVSQPIDAKPENDKKQAPPSQEVIEIEAVASHSTQEESEDAVNKSQLWDDEANPVEAAPTVGAVSDSDSQKDANPPTSNNLRSQLRNSFMAFDAFLGPAPATPAKDDASQYTEVTIETRLQDGQPDADMMELKTPTSFDNSEYMEVTVVDTVVADTVEGTPHEKNDTREEALPESSMHMKNMLLSSRMFADDFNTNPTFQHEYNGEHPTVTVNADFDDDDMTQITFDQSHFGYGHTGNDGQRKHHDDEDTYGFGDLVNDPPESMQLPDSSNHSRGSDLSAGKQTVRGSQSSGISEKLKQRIAELLRKDIWSRDGEVVKSALLELGEEASTNPACRDNIVRFGGVMAIIRAMDMNPQNEKIHVAACDALTNLALDAETQVAISEVGGVSAIVGAMKEHPDHVELQSAACAALASITRSLHSQTSRESIVEEVDDAVQALLMALKGHTRHPVIQAKAFGALANLSMQNQDRLVEFSKAGGIDAMTSALQQPWEDIQEQHEAVSSLSLLLRCLIDQRSAQKEALEASKSEVRKQICSESESSEGVPEVSTEDKDCSLAVKEEAPPTEDGEGDNPSESKEDVTKDDDSTPEEGCVIQ